VQYSARDLIVVETCSKVGTTWCRYGVGDSVGLAVQLEERYKGVRSPHKIKGGVSGCIRECAEAQSKVGVLINQFIFHDG
jgi:nitrite reductase (NAD(P)H)